MQLPPKLPVFFNFTKNKKFLLWIKKFFTLQFWRSYVLPSVTKLRDNNCIIRNHVFFSLQFSRGGFGSIDIEYFVGVSAPALFLFDLSHHRPLHFKILSTYFNYKTQKLLSIKSSHIRPLYTFTKSPRYVL